MPSNGDNKPKLNKIINKVITTVESDTNIGFMISVVALLLLLTDIVILALAGMRWMNDESLDYGFVWLTVATLILSGAFLFRKHQ